MTEKTMDSTLHTWGRVAGSASITPTFVLQQKSGGRWVDRYSDEDGDKILADAEERNAKLAQDDSLRKHLEYEFRAIRRSVREDVLERSPTHCPQCGSAYKPTPDGRGYEQGLCMPPMALSTHGWCETIRKHVEEDSDYKSS